MKQYLDLLREIKEKGTHKDAARANMPGTTSLFGHQMRFDLSQGFPILTTKKVSFKNIVTELLWFLRGDTNIKYLIDNGCNIWNEDAYNYYVKIASKNLGKEANNIYHHNGDGTLRMYSFEEFIEVVKGENYEEAKKVSSYKNYVLGDCGKQYGWLWRKWQGIHQDENGYTTPDNIDQIKELISALKSNPLGRRHIITAWNPATLEDMALNACHCFIQFNCRPLNTEERWELWHKSPLTPINLQKGIDDELNRICDECNIPNYYLDCQMYQRSGDAIIGVPYNISSYALLIEILAKICNMIPGDFIHSFGDVHIYDNHIDAVNEQLTRTPDVLPKLKINEPLDGVWDFDEMINYIQIADFKLEGYNPQPAIKAELSTGLIK